MIFHANIQIVPKVIRAAQKSHDEHQTAPICHVAHPIARMRRCLAAVCLAARIIVHVHVVHHSVPINTAVFHSARTIIAVSQILP